MSDAMMKALQIQNESLTRQVEQLGTENKRVRKLLTEFDRRHNIDQVEIKRLRDEMSNVRPRSPIEECPECNGTGMRDSGGVQPWGEPISVPCDCDFVQHTRHDLAQAEIDRLREALRKIANGEGVYGQQAHEYKQIARAALENSDE